MLMCWRLIWQIVMEAMRMAGLALSMRAVATICLGEMHPFSLRMCHTVTHSALQRVARKLVHQIRRLPGIPCQDCLQRRTIGRAVAQHQSQTTQIVHLCATSSVQGAMR